ncbi:diguanylate cyclase, partial [Acidithiobacillus caldus]
PPPPPPKVGMIVIHNQRVKSFIGALHSSAPFPALVTEPDAENSCHLGLWLLGEGKLQYGGNAALYRQLQERHARLHALAREAKALYDAGDKKGALQKGMDLERENEKLMALLKQ